MTANSVDSLDSATVLVTDYDFPDFSIEREVFEDLDVTLETSQAATAAEVAEAAAAVEADALLNQYAPVDGKVFEAVPSLRIVSRYGRGVDNVDVAAATAHGVMVANCPAYCQPEVATHALSLLLACQRHVVSYDRAIKGGTWDWKLGKPMRRVGEQRLGLISFGGISRTLAAYAQGLGFEVTAFDPYVEAEEMEAAGVTKVDFDTLLATADAVSVHAPLTNETRHLFDESAFASMQESAVLVNTARGGLVDETALARALERDELACAGLDVMETEPPTDSPLLDRDDVILTPHVAWYSEDSRRELQRTTAENVRAVIEGRVPDTVVNPDALD